MNYLYAMTNVDYEDARVFINAKLLAAEERTSTALHRIFKAYQERRFKDVKKTWVVYLSKIHELSRQERQAMIDRNKMEINIFGSEQQRGLKEIAYWFNVENSTTATIFFVMNRTLNSSTRLKISQPPLPSHF